MSHAWTTAEAEKARRLCSEYTRGDLGRLADRLTEEMGVGVSPDSLNALFKRRRWGAPSRWCRDGDLCGTATRATLPSAATVPLFLHTPPPPAMTAAELLEDEDAVTSRRVVEHESKVGLEEGACRVHVDRTPEPIQYDRRRYTIAVASDLHFGSEYIRRGALRDFATEAHERGITKVLVPGDLLDGFYDRHGKFQLSHVGITAQAMDLQENLPHLSGLTYDAILGNHDETYADMSGLNVGEYLSLKLQAAGRDDVRFHGEREAYLRVHGTEFCLWHPRGSFSQLAMRKQILGFKPGTDPRFLLVGHWHHFDIVKHGRCLAIACPSFQGGGSPFGKSLPGHTTVGGFFLSWELDSAGEVHSVGIERREYPEPVTSRVVDVA